MDYPKIGVVGKPFNTQGKMDFDWNNYSVTSGVISNLVNEKRWNCKFSYTNNCRK